jgi:hypothetical protein
MKVHSALLNIFKRIAIDVLCRFYFFFINIPMLNGTGIEVESVCKWYSSQAHTLQRKARLLS